MNRKHVIVMGPGNCGTSYLVEVLRELGYDTGDAIDFWREKRREIGAGEITEFPYVIKSTSFGPKLKERAKRYGWEPEFIFVCYRQKGAWIDSRLSKPKNAKALRDMENPREYLEQVEADRLLGECLSAAAEFPDTPLIMVQFPQSTDPWYLRSRLKAFAPDTTQNQVEMAVKTALKPEKVRHGG